MPAYINIYTPFVPFLVCVCTLAYMGLHTYTHTYTHNTNAHTHKHKQTHKRIHVPTYTNIGSRRAGEAITPKKRQDCIKTTRRAHGQILQHTATHCNALQHTAIHRQHIGKTQATKRAHRQTNNKKAQCPATHCSALQQICNHRQRGERTDKQTMKHFNGTPTVIAYDRTRAYVTECIHR